MVDGFYQANVPARPKGGGGFCAAFEVRGGRVMVTAPILKWALGGQADVLSSWVRRKGGAVVLVAKQEGML